MVILFSEHFDISTSEVMEWIDHLGGEPVRLNGSEIFEANTFAHSLSLDNATGQKLQIRFRGKDIKAEDITYVWFRRDEQGSMPPYIRAIKDKSLRKKVAQHLSIEMLRAKDFLKIALLQKPHIGNPRERSFAKFLPLQIAQSLDIDIPATLITERKKELQDFKNKHRKVITKAISDSDFFELDDGTVISSYTNEIDQEILDSAHEQFGVTLAQEMLEKELEIRSFYLFGKFYSMAIFSQIDQKTAVDFRRYNIQKPNRNVPFRLSEELERKADQLMRTLGLNTGSLDFVKTTDGRYVFLEVNPVGQFGMTSKPCNYYLEKILASYMTSQEPQRNQGYHE